MTESPLAQALADLEPLLVDDEFVLIGYPRGRAPATPDAFAAEAYAVRIDDPLETTFVIRAPLADSLPEPAVRQGPLRAIVLVAAVEPGLTGLVSVIAGAFAERGIAVISMGSATRAHLLVPADSWPEALAVLRGLRDAARSLRGPDPPAFV